MQAGDCRVCRPFVVAVPESLWTTASSLPFWAIRQIEEAGGGIGFAGPRVLKQTINQELPPDFQTAEFLLEHGFIDMIVERKDIKPTVAQVLSYLT